MNINVLSISQRWGVLLLIIECKLSGSLTQEVRCIAEYSVKARTPRKPKPLMLIFDFSKSSGKFLLPM
jgi:hypothetical protein